MKVEQMVMQYIDREQIDRAHLAAQTKLPKELLEEDRDWSAEEFLRVCAALGVDPWQFFDGIGEKREE